MKKQNNKGMKNLIEYTNAKLNNWYKNALIDFNVEGWGNAKIENGNFIINYVENGIGKTFVEPYFGNEEKDFFFNVWMEQA